MIRGKFRKGSEKYHKSSKNSKFERNPKIEPKVQTIPQVELSKWKLLNWKTLELRNSKFKTKNIRKEDLKIPKNSLQMFQELWEIIKQ